ncbi:MAG: hypothetical protein WDN67_02600 [Candidatus Moraniibacteriota bacterium]
MFPKRPFDDEVDRAFFRIVRAGFSARRKTLTNNLAALLPLKKEALAEILISLGLRPDVRPQALSVEQWLALVAALEKAA